MAKLIFGIVIGLVIAGYSWWVVQNGAVHVVLATLLLCLILWAVYYPLMWGLVKIFEHFGAFRTDTDPLE